VDHGKPRKGDTVRLTIEGVVTYTEGSGFTVDDTPRTANGVFFRYDNPSLKNVEVTQRKYQIGDRVHHFVLDVWAPAAGTLIQHTTSPGHARFMKMKTGDHWVDEMGVILKAAQTMPVGEYQILMLPGEWLDIS
jgi:hypothetical protein